MAEQFQRTASYVNVAHANEVFAEYGDFIRRIACFCTSSEAEADDLFQDFYLQVASRPIPSDVKNVRGYIYRCIVNRAKDITTKAIRYGHRLRRYSCYVAPCLEATPEVSAIGAEQKELLLNLIQRCLDEREKTAIKLKYYDSKSTKEAAAQMGIKTGSVRRYLTSGFRRIRQLVKVEQGASRDVL
ncbi:MAG: sigma-70 family RNA polymerase sigma factor [Planctomycetes bacterium]|nr:sigma-70 family RNA polymerase sigma factor [Planctomycetota bacterium]